jgi:glutamate synthase domain-containing protein 2
LPGAKVTAEIANARGVPIGVDCISPARHSAFKTPTEMMHFIAQLRELSGGKPVGFKLCIGHPWEFMALCKAMLETGIRPDFIVIDGSEGGTGAAPLESWITSARRCARVWCSPTIVWWERACGNPFAWGASGRVVTAFDIARLLALGADWCNAARGFMFALGCIQAQVCHTDRCPTGVSTQNLWRQRALVVDDKTARVRQFHQSTLAALGELVGAAGLAHPRDLRPIISSNGYRPAKSKASLKSARS